MIIAGGAALMAGGVNAAKLIASFQGTSFRPADYGAINQDRLLFLNSYGFNVEVGTPAFNAGTYTDNGNPANGGNFCVQVIRDLVAVSAVLNLSGSGSYTRPGFKRHPRHIGLLVSTEVLPQSLSSAPGITIAGVTFNAASYIYSPESGGNWARALFTCSSPDQYRDDTLIQISAPSSNDGGASITLYELLGAG